MMKRLVGPESSLWLCACLLLATSPAKAVQEEEQQQLEEQEVFVERVAVDVVNVEVFVTDKEGRPVRGLTREDFEIREDGRPVEIVNFYHVSDRRPVLETKQPLDSVQDEDDPAPDQRQPLPLVEEPTIPESQRLHMIIYVDNFNIHPLNRNRVFRSLRVFLLDSVGPGDEVMVVTFDRSLNIRQPFTTSPESVSSALRQIEGMSGFAIERESERSAAIKEIYETDSLHTAEFQAKNFAENQYHEVNNTLNGLREMLDSLAGLPGRKMLVHVSDGLATVPGQDLYQAIQQRFAAITAMGESFSYDLSRRYMQVIAHANSNRVSFYTIDAGGLRTQSGMGAENPAANFGRPIELSVDGIRRKNLQGTLVMMANRTGGQYIINTNDVSLGLERFAQDIGNYYSLGYRAPTVDRGRYHKIEVRLKDDSRNLDVRHREGYRDKSIQAQLEDSVQAFLVHGYETNPLGVSIDIGQPREASDGLIQVPVRIRVPMENVVLLPRGSVYEGRLHLYFGASDEDGREAPLQEMPLLLQIPEDSIDFARSDEVSRVIDATIRPGPHKLVVAVRDEISEDKSVVGRFLNFGDASEREQQPELPPALDFRRQ